MGYAGGPAILDPGDNNLRMTGVFIENPTGSAKARKLFSSYLQGIPTIVQMTGRPELCSSFLIAKAFEGLSVDANIPGLADGLILEARLLPNILGAMFGNKDMPTRMYIRNPLDAAIRVLKLNFAMETVEAQPEPLGRLDLDTYSNPIVLAPQAVSLTPEVIATVPLSVAAIQALFAGQFSLKAFGTMEIMIGTYRTTIDYVQVPVKTVICPDPGCMVAPL